MIRAFSSSPPPTLSLRGGRGAARGFAGHPTTPLRPLWTSLRAITQRYAARLHGSTNTLAFGPGEKLKLVTVPILKVASRHDPEFSSLAQTPHPVLCWGHPPRCWFHSQRSRELAASYTNSWALRAVSPCRSGGQCSALGLITLDYASVIPLTGVDYQAISDARIPSKRPSKPHHFYSPPGAVPAVKIHIHQPTGGATLGPSPWRIEGAYAQ
jgi:hypothetical protein